MLLSGRVAQAWIGRVTFLSAGVLYFSTTIRYSEEFHNRPLLTLFASVRPDYSAYALQPPRRNANSDAVFFSLRRLLGTHTQLVNKLLQNCLSPLIMVMLGLWRPLCVVTNTTDFLQQPAAASVCLHDSTQLKKCDHTLFFYTTTLVFRDSVFFCLPRYLASGGAAQLISFRLLDPAGSQQQHHCCIRCRQS